MSMKINGQHQSAEADRTRRGEAATAPGKSGGSSTAASRVGAGTDRVETSADLQLAAAAMKVASTFSPIRPEAIARAQQAIEDGTLGADPEFLADRILDALLEQ